MSCSVLIYLHTAPADTLPANELQLPSYMRVKDSSCQYKARGSKSMSFLSFFLLPYSLQSVTDWMTPVWRLFFHKSPTEFPISHPSFWDYQQRGSKSAKWSFSCCFLRRILNFQSLRLLLPLSLSRIVHSLCFAVYTWVTHQSMSATYPFANRVTTQQNNAYGTNQQPTEGIKYHNYYYYYCLIFFHNERTYANWNGNNNYYRRLATWFLGIILATAASCD